MYIFKNVKIITSESSWKYFILILVYGDYTFIGIFLFDEIQHFDWSLNPLLDNYTCKFVNVLCIFTPNLLE